MIKGIRQKKIMLLGGIYYLKPAIEAAHKLGLYVITADYLPNNVAHQWSDEFVNVSIIDKEAVLKVAREKEIDGILSYAVDPGVVTAAYVAEQMGLPNVGPYKSVEILQNKALFRQFLADNGFNTPKSKGYFSVEEALKDADVFDYPVIVKPVDSAGSKGVTRVNGRGEIKAALEHAYQCSLGAKEIIVEDFIELDGYQSGSDSFSVDGKMVFTSFDDQLFDKHAANPYAPSAHTWPSTMPQWAQEELSSEIQRLVTLLGMRTSLYNIEARVGKNGKAYIMELSPRAGGNRLSEVLTMATGVDFPMACVKAAMGMSIEMDTPCIDGYWADVVLHAPKEGVLKSVEIAEPMKSHVKELTLYKQVGETVCGFSAANAAIGSLFMQFDTREQIERYFDWLNEMVKIKVL